jgi:hypothetical protein
MQLMGEKACSGFAVFDLRAIHALRMKLLTQNKIRVSLHQRLAATTLFNAKA